MILRRSLFCGQSKKGLLQVPRIKEVINAAIFSTREWTKVGARVYLLFRWPVKRAAPAFTRVTGDHLNDNARTRILLLGHNTISTLGLSFRNTFFSRRGQCARYMFLTIGACVVVAESCGCSGEVECALQWGFVNTLSRYERCVSGLRCRSVFAQVDQFYVPVICFEREMDYFRSFSCRLNIFFLPYAMILS